MLKLILNQKGDTIVEVMIAMVILAFVLTGAYTSAQYSLNNITNAENRITGLNIASGQIEALKELLANDPTSIKTDNGDFYLNNGNQQMTSSPQSTIQNGTFYYEFSQPVYVTTDNADDYIFTVNVYWRDLDFNPVNNSCSAGNLSNCDEVSISYQAAI
jgi:prepilin-type N-terminal cleavage/methylation domain-containing protein